MYMLVAFLTPRIIGVVTASRCVTTVCVVPPVSTTVFRGTVSGVCTGILLCRGGASCVVVTSVYNTMLGVMLGTMLVPLFKCRTTTCSVLVTFMFLSCIRVHISGGLRFAVAKAGRAMCSSGTVVNVR